MGIDESGFTPLAEGVWCASAPVQHLGMHLTATMTALRLGDGSLLLHSPIELGAAAPRSEATVVSSRKIDRLRR